MSKKPVLPPTQFSTWRMECRKYEQADANKFYQIIRENRTRLIDRFPELVQQTDEDDVQSVFNGERITSWEEGKSFSYSIWDKKTQQYAGEITLTNFDWQIPRGEITCFLTKEFEGKGMMSEVFKPIIKIAFEELKLNKLCIRMRPHNNRSSQLARRAGFMKEGIIRNDFVKWNDTLCDLCYYGITSQDYFKAQSLMSHQYAPA
jgi:RimJ/RimL family protein N-acetyltransferase